MQERVHQLMNKLLRVTMPNSVTSIGEVAFTSCTNLAIIVLGSSINSIGRESFDGCTSLRGAYFSD
jgi:hypothetical protein